MMPSEISIPFLQLDCGRCERVFLSDIGATRKEAAQLARSEGWVVTPSTHEILCPDCAQKEGLHEPRTTTA